MLHKPPCGSLGDNSGFGFALKPNDHSTWFLNFRAEAHCLGQQGWHTTSCGAWCGPLHRGTPAHGRPFGMVIGRITQQASRVGCSNRHPETHEDHDAKEGWCHVKPEAFCKEVHVAKRQPAAVAVVEGAPDRPPAAPRWLSVTRSSACDNCCCRGQLPARPGCRPPAHCRGKGNRRGPVPCKGPWWQSLRPSRRRCAEQPGEAPMWEGGLLPSFR